MIFIVKDIMKEQILKLREEGKSYKQIKAILGCSSATISYHCGEGQKEKTKQRTRKIRENILQAKLTAFKHRKVKSKFRDFQRRDGSQMMNRQENNFTIDEVMNKLGTNPRCYLSGELIDITDTKAYHLDHVIPVHRGGDNNIDNLGILTANINRMKYTLTVDEFISKCMQILEYNGYKVEKK